MTISLKMWRNVTEIKSLASGSEVHKREDACCRDKAWAVSFDVEASKAFFQEIGNVPAKVMASGSFNFLIWIFSVIVAWWSAKATTLRAVFRVPVAHACHLKGSGVWRDGETFTYACSVATVSSSSQTIYSPDSAYDSYASE